MKSISSQESKPIPCFNKAYPGWRDLEKVFLALDPDLCEAHWRFDCQTAARDAWKLRLDDRDSDANLLVQTIREAGRKLRCQSGSKLVPRRLADDLSDPLESWLAALRHNQVNCEYLRGEWRVEAGVVHSLPVSSALLCRALANRVGSQAFA